MSHKRLRVLLPGALLLFVLAPLPGFAGNPLKTNPDGSPVVWNTERTIRYKVDPKGLGRLSLGQSLYLLQRAMSVWEGVAGTGIRFEYAGLESSDITGGNWRQYAPQHIAAADQRITQTPSQQEGYLLVVFDDDGTILPNFTPSSVPGSATITAYTGPLANPGSIKSATLFLNGLYLDGDESGVRDMRIEDMLAVTVHELGHVLGLNHSVFNQTIFNDIIYHGLNPAYARYLPTMFPSVIRGQGEHLVNLHPDDIATLKWMYHAPGVTFAEGNVFDAAGSPLYSMVVTARDVDSPLCNAYSQATSVTCDYKQRAFQVAGQPGTSPGAVCEDASRLGYYEMPLLGAGDYTLDVGEVSTAFGTSVISQFRLGSYPLMIPGGAELFNAGDAAGEDAMEYDVVSINDDTPAMNFKLASTDAAGDRLRRVHHAFFENDFFGQEPDQGGYCPKHNTLDVAATIALDNFEIGTNVIDGSSTASSDGSASGSASDSGADSPVTLDSGVSAGGGCSMASATPSGWGFLSLFACYAVVAPWIRFFHSSRNQNT